MPQPPRYSRATQFAEEERSNAGGRSTVRTAQVDAELDAIAVAVNAIRAVIALNQRDDGEIGDGRVKLPSLGTDVLALLASYGATPRGAWVTATAYALKDLVTQTGKTYMCALAHTSGTFATDLAAVKWLLLSLDANPAATAIPFTPTATLAGTNVQTALDEADTENRALSAAIRSDLLDTTSAAKGAGIVLYDYSKIYPVRSLGLANFGRPPATWAMSDAQVSDVLARTASLNVAAALNTIIATGYEIDFPPGTYGIQSPLSWLAQQTLRGRKRAQTSIKAIAGFAGTALIDVPSGAYSGMTLDGFLLNGNGLAAKCLSMIGASQGAVDQIILRDVEAALATTTQIYLENLTGSEFEHVITNGGNTHGLHLKTCYTSTSRSCTSYNSGVASVMLENCADTKLHHHNLFNNPGNASTSLLKIDGGHGNIARECTLEAQGAANVTQEVLIVDTVSGNCTDNAFIDCEFIGQASTKTRCLTIGASGSVYKTHIDGCRFIKPSATESILLTSQADTEICRSVELVTYDTPTYAPVTVLDNSGNGYRRERQLGQFSSLSTETTVAFPATQVPSADPYTLDDYREYLGSGLAKVALTITGSTTNPTSLAAAGSFNADMAVKAGRLFCLKHNFGAITWATPGTGIFQINLPFSIYGMAHVQGTLFTTAVVGEMNGTVLTLYPVGSATALTWAAIAASGASLILQINGIANT